jgi:hypothetical protein
MAQPHSLPSRAIQARVVALPASVSGSRLANASARCAAFFNIVGLLPESKTRGCQTTTGERAGGTRNLNAHFFPFPGKRPTAKITPSVVQDWVTQAVAGGLKPRSIRKYHTMLHSIFKRAVRDQLIAVNPCEHTELPKIIVKTLTLTPKEFDVLIGAIPERHR